MIENGLFSISEFARYTRTTRDTLLHYDQIGLLSPASRGENNYRYYAANQLPVVFVIRALLRLGMSLEEIKEIRSRKTPELTEDVLEQQVKKIDKHIEDWIRARKLLIMLKDMIQSVSGVDHNAISIQHVPAQAIILGKLNDFSNNRTDLDALIDFYQDMSRSYPKLDLSYPVWWVFTEEQIRQGKYNEPNRFYFHNPEGHDIKPAALYAVGYVSDIYDSKIDLYDRMLSYIYDNGYEVCGDIYEEYPLTESCISEHSNSLIRVMITVRKK